VSPRVLVVAVSLTALVTQPVAGQWTQDGWGGVWIKSALSWQDTDTEFGPAGQRRQRIDLGRSRSRAIFTDIIVGVHRSVDLWIQVPYLDLRFTTDAEDLRSTGFGDLRAWIRWQTLNLGAGATPIAFRVGAKAPLGFAPLDVAFVPLGEGQWDLELFGEVGHSLWPVPAYAELWLGYRIRMASETTQKDPGDEYVFLAEIGTNPTARTLVKATFDGFVGSPWVVEGVETSTSRRIFTLQLIGAVRVLQRLWLEGGARFPVAGRSFPAGSQFVVAVSSAFDFRRRQRHPQ
jgi:hypothetical protein